MRKRGGKTGRTLGLSMLVLTIRAEFHGVTKVLVAFSSVDRIT
jgi:hypothetical protein